MNTILKRHAAAWLLLAWTGCLWPLPVADAQEPLKKESRIKDVARIVGLDDVELIGYGLVVGLNDSGDGDLTMKRQTVAKLLNQFQITVPEKEIDGQNVAAVMVTARLSPFYHAGDRIDAVMHPGGDKSESTDGAQ